MSERATLRRLEDFGLPLGRRSPRGAYFVRVCGWSDAVREGLVRFCALARGRGVIVEDRVANPDEGQIAGLTRALGPDFEPTAAFAEAALAKWLPDMPAAARSACAAALAEEYAGLAAQGKPAGVMKNLFVKVMCWLNYRFGRMMPLLKDEDPPKLLYAGSDITAHELALLRMLCAMGVDILLAEPRGDAAYLRLDPDSRWSQRFDAGDAPFPQDFSIRSLRDAARDAEGPEPAQAVRTKPQTMNLPPRRFLPPTRTICTNGWMAEKDYRQILTPPAKRGDDPKAFFNAFVRLSGVEDRVDYVGDLYRFYRELVAGGRAVTVVDDPMPAPQPEEISAIRRRGRYDSAEEMIADLAGNLPVDVRDELLRQMRQSFLRVMREAAEAQDNLHRLTATAVYLLCRIRRYCGPLFKGWREADVPVFLWMGGCHDADEALFARFLSALPADVLLLAPDLNRPCALEDPALLDLRGEESLPVMKFPRDDASLRMSTMAAHAERDLDGLLYSDSDLYRSRQFGHAAAVTLRTTYDELFLLWEQELKYRQGFAVDQGTVSMPVLFAKISGVEAGDLNSYWKRVRQLTEGDVFYAGRMPVLPPAGGNPYQSLALSALRNGRLNRAALTADRRYPFGLLREEIQRHILDKLQLMLDRRLIRGTFVNGTEYKVVSTVLNLDRALVRALQGFDFTRRNPKAVFVSTGEEGASLEDAILLTFLNLAGFDVALFVPTGYQSVERYMADDLPVEHQIGQYMYDLVVPDLSALPGERAPSWLDRLFRRES